MTRRTLALVLVLSFLGGPAAAAVAVTCGMSAPAEDCCCDETRSCPVDLPEGLSQSRCCDMGTPEMPAEVPAQAPSGPREVPPPAPAQVASLSGTLVVPGLLTEAAALHARDPVPRLPAYDLFCTYLI